MAKITDFQIKVFLNKMMVHHCGNNPLDRNMMSSLEIKAANKLVAMGKLTKGRTHQGRVNFYYE